MAMEGMIEVPDAGVDLPNENWIRDIVEGKV